MGIHCSALYDWKQQYKHIRHLRDKGQTVVEQFKPTEQLCSRIHWANQARLACC